MRRVQIELPKSSNRWFWVSSFNDPAGVSSVDAKNAQSLDLRSSRLEIAHAGCWFNDLVELSLDYQVLLVLLRSTIN